MKKVNLEGLMQVPVVIMALVVAAAIGVAGFLALDGLDDNLCGPGDNVSTTDVCEDPSAGYNASAQITTGIGNIFDFAPTWGTLIGVAVLILIIAGAFVGGVVGYKAGKNKGYF